MFGVFTKYLHCNQMKSEKTILHMDGDAFFVAVEVAKNSKLRGLPVVTGAERGMVTALSYEAKALGVVRGMPIFKVKQAFPSVLVLPGDYASYARYSGMMFDIVRRYADEVEEYSIDECFADMTGLDRTLKMTHREIAECIQREVSDELGLSVTIGIATTKVLAKIASKYEKPHGLTEITQHSLRVMLANTPIETLWGIGPRVAVRLRVRGVYSALDFTQRDTAWVRRNFAKPQEAIWQELQGVAVYPVNGAKKSTFGSMQRTRTFSPATSDANFLLGQLERHIEDACMKARHYNLAPKKLMLYLRTQSFASVVHIVPLEIPSASPSILIGYLRKNFPNVYTAGVQYRSAGITLCDLVGTACLQESLFASEGDIENKFASVHAHIDALEEKHGKPMVYLASSHHTRHASGRGGDDFERMDSNLLFL
jgi:nucleotidyltransferase/DNA polymerase involved in DNA repair